MEQKRALVAMTTTGTRSETTDVIKNIKLSLRTVGLGAVFSVYSDTLRLFTNSEDEYYSLANRKEFDYSRNILTATDVGIRRFDPDFITTIGDDYIDAARHMSEMVKPLMRDSYGVFGSWGSSTIAATYPRIRYVSDLFVNKMVNACRKFDVNYSSLMQVSFSYRNDFRNLIQVYTGAYAFRTGDWLRVRNKIMEIFKTDKLGWSLEVCTLLACFECGIQPVAVPYNRVNDSNPPFKGEKATRLMQLKDALKYINVFLEHTSQADKLAKLLPIEERMIRAIENWSDS